MLIISIVTKHPACIDNPIDTPVMSFHARKVRHQFFLDKPGAVHYIQLNLINQNRLSYQIPNAGVEKWRR